VKVMILMGSDSDMAVMGQAARALEELGVACELAVASAHRSPDWVREVLAKADGAGAEVFIAGAGGAAHLAGFVAAHTLRPVIGVPLSSGLQGGLDALLSTVQMPRGVPVACVAVDGAANAGLLAAQILAVSDPALRERLEARRRKMAEEVRRKSTAGSSPGRA